MTRTLGLALLVLVSCGQASPPNADPDTGADTEVISSADRAALQAECAREQGLNAWADGPSLVVEGISDDQAHIVDEIVSACMHSVEQDHPYPKRDFSSEETRLDLYGLYVDQWRCLENLGLEIPPPPTADSWLEAFETEPWDPYFHVRKQVRDEAYWNEVNAACPQVIERVFVGWERITVDPSGERP